MTLAFYAFLNWLRHQRNRFVRVSFRLLGWRLLYKNESDAYLLGNLVEQHPIDTVELPDVSDLINPEQCVFRAKVAQTLPAYVWQLPTEGRATTVLPSGVVQYAGTVLCTDYWNHHVAVDRFRNRKRILIEVDNVVAPFGHRPDGITFGGYYDYLYLIFAKLCRIEQTLPEGFANVAITYPLFHTPYEAELLSLLGFTPDRIFDSRQFEVRAQQYLLASGGDWFYPNVADLALCRDRLAALLNEATPALSGPERIYISRAGRRRITNEDALLNTLARYGFEFIEDKPRTMAEQLNLYHRASYIIGPHGASFSNINWCRPGTNLHELCSVNYAPDFFLYIAQVRQMAYSVSRHGLPSRQSIRRSLVEDITVSVSDVERVLHRLLTD